MRETVYSEKLCIHGHNVKVNGRMYSIRYPHYGQDNRLGPCVECEKRYVARFRDSDSYREKNRKYQGKWRDTHQEETKSYQSEYQRSERQKDPERYAEYRRRTDENKKRAAKGLPPIKYPRKQFVWKEETPEPSGFHIPRPSKKSGRPKKVQPESISHSHEIIELRKTK